ncbi:hypothetical protein B0I37DRAFT_43612 [Chaetomium sp. MPI-CAGE-AT-0009]|nr:hypothetical protein B0I37DRAFT_43612 [Chaetomium sp. MPI-CAGE-AT-0009]
MASSNLPRRRSDGVPRTSIRFARRALPSSKAVCQPRVRLSDKKTQSGENRSITAGVGAGLAGLLAAGFWGRGWRFRRAVSKPPFDTPGRPAAEGCGTAMTKQRQIRRTPYPAACLIQETTGDWRPRRLSPKASLLFPSLTQFRETVSRTAPVRGSKRESFV